MKLSPIQKLASFWGAADSNADYQNQPLDTAFFEERQATLKAQGKDEHAAYHKVAYEVCLAELTLHPHWGIQALQMVGEGAIIDSLKDAEMQSQIVASPA